MITWAAIFLVVAIVSGLLGFMGIAGVATGFAKILFFVGLILAVVTWLLSSGRRHQLPP